MRGGTEATALVVGFGEACKLALARLATDDWVRTGLLRDDFEERVQALVPGSAVNGAGQRLPNTSNIHLPGMDGDALVTFLDQRGICVSSGSACMERAITPSHVLLAMFGDHDRANESLRVSIGVETTREEIDSLLAGIKDFAEVA